MKKQYSIILIGLVLAVSAATAQKEGDIWFFGGGHGSADSVYRSSRFDFSFDPPQATYISKILPFNRTNSVLSDPDGNLLCISNGENLYNADYDIMDNGADFYPNSDYFYGFPFIQGFLLLPLPGSPEKAVHLYGRIKTVFPPPPNTATLGYIETRYSIADMSLNNGLGKVVQRDLLACTDTLFPSQITATRHGNGRDWWVLIPHYIDSLYYRFVLSPSGLDLHGKQQMGMPQIGLGQACFSPNGEWYARFNVHGLTDSSYSTMDLHRFDRCTGMLGPRISRTYNPDNPESGKPGGVAFSPNSRFLYVSRWDTIFQYDLHETDVVASETVVAVYDGFAGDLGLPTRFYSMLLGPDNRIYCCVSNYSSRYLHVIESPDLKGGACDVRQHAVELPTFNIFLVPNIPHYRLYDWDGSPCDTLGITGPPLSARPEVRRLQARVYPNPASGAARIELSEPAAGQCRLRLYNLTGQLVRSEVLAAGTVGFDLPVGDLHNGHYFLHLTDEHGKVWWEKLVVLH